jgi:transcriptional regulator with XRE-family HTH domain
MKSQISERIRAARLAAGLTQAQLAATLGTHQSVVAGWERGLAPRAYRLPQIAAALGVTVDALVCGQSDEASNTGENNSDNKAAK